MKRAAGGGRRTFADARIGFDDPSAALKEREDRQKQTGQTNNNWPKMDWSKT